MEKEKRNRKAFMEYRRFGKTNLKVSVINIGTMRYKHVWDKPADEIPKDTIEQCKTSVQLALKNGINLIETAHGYTKSEHCLGIVLNDELNVPRDRYYIMTKGHSATDAKAREMVEKQLKALKTDKLEFYAWHGINNQELFIKSCKKRGPVEELLKMKEEGMIDNVGFSTHGPLDVICRAIETGLFSFVNLHYYYFFQRNYGAIALAEAKDMGVLIISPNDKGGQLFSPPPVLKSITHPYTPVQWNSRFCLSMPAVHTLAFGTTEPEHFTEIRGIFPTSIPLTVEDQEIMHNLKKRELTDKYASYEGYDLQGDPSRINIPDILRLRKMWKCYDMKEFAQYRYNTLEPDDTWFPGYFATPENIDRINMDKVPDNIPLKEMLHETHKALYKKK